MVKKVLYAGPPGYETVAAVLAKRPRKEDGVPIDTAKREHRIAGRRADAAEAAGFRRTRMSQRIGQPHGVCRVPRQPY